MRILRIITAIVFVFSLLFAGWANNRYNSKRNADYPEMTSDVELLEISVQDPPEAIFRDLHAHDATDGDLTDQIMVATVSHFLEPGTVRVKYVVFDQHNNSATLTRRVHYTDYEAPKFSLERNPVYTDGDISDHIRVISNMVNTYSVGKYPVVLEVSNSFGDTAQVTVWVAYEAKQNTAIVKLHQYIVYVEQGGTFEPEKWLASVTDRDSDSLGARTVDLLGSLDLNKPGCYQLVYSYNDGVRSGQAPLTVVVTERQE